ncbi:MAG: HD domain-containing protein [Coleofasciculaceae cyanobacterium SM2_1_6]|nr:HD domain-containing protein [Coleofasciculaceae cyanobacterium SM2_1_6]
MVEPEPSNPALIDQLLAIGSALSSTSNLDSLLNLILYKSREITCSDAGSVYLIDRSTETPRLVFKTSQNDYLGRNVLEEYTMPMTYESLAGYVALTGESLNIPDAYALPKDVPYTMNQDFDRSIPYYTRSVLVLPMQDQDKETIGVLQLINRKINSQVVLNPANARDVTQPYSEWEEKVICSLASQAAISIERSLLQSSIEQLFAGFVKASVKIIEARDPATSGHSERVAELTVRLTEEVNMVGSGSLGLLYFNNRQIQEIRYAALLHDFGKVSIPERVLNKRKKLHPSQLEVIHQRFTIVKQALKMQCAEAKFRYLIEHPHSHKSSYQSTHRGNPPLDSESDCHHCTYLENLEADLAAAIAQLEEYWELVLQMNKPDLERSQFKSFTEATLTKLTNLTNYTYRDAEGKLRPLLTPIEIQQLMIPQGNLTVHERRRIETHVSNTYEFLQQIPWTKYLKGVPRIAYAHHEKLDGSGYPQGLTAKDIPFQSQLITIADIYDALTAADRPYKKRLDTETASQILRAEATKNRINQDFVDIFLQREVFTVLGHHR